jgi:ferredoxin-NADP reductase
MSTERRMYEAIIERIDEVAPETRAFFLHLPAGSGFTFVPGQFISCLLSIDGSEVIRPYSIASDPGADLLEICLNRVPGGIGSAHLFQLQAGARVRFTGPWGTFLLREPPAAACVFIADGTGIAPIRPMLHRALENRSGGPVALHYAAASAAHLLYLDELEALQRTHATFTFTPLIGTPLVPFIEQRYVLADADRGRHFWICGVGGIVPQLRDLLRRAGYERRAVQYEKW